MNLVVHRGINEIGGGCVEIATDKSHVLIDKRISFKDIEEILCLVALKLPIAVHEMVMNHCIEN